MDLWLSKLKARKLLLHMQKDVSGEEMLAWKRSLPAYLWLSLSLQAVEELTHMTALTFTGGFSIYRATCLLRKKNS